MIGISMNFERHKDPKESIGIGIEAFLIKKISETLSHHKHREYNTYELTIERNTNNPGTKASWIQPLTGYYFKLIKDTKNRLFLEDSDYSYYLEYDHGLHYGNMFVDNFIK